MAGKENTKANDKATEDTELPPDEIFPFLDNPFLEDFRGHTIIYCKDFYVAMYKKIHDEGMTYVEAYNALGFDTKILGENRANSAGKRVMQMARENRLFTVDPASFDGSVPREAMGSLSPEEELAYLKARNMYLEMVIEAQKKNAIVIGGNVYIFETRKLNVDLFQMADNAIQREKEKENGLCTIECLKIFGVSKSGYYAWKKKKAEKPEKEEEKKKELAQVMNRFREIVKKLGFVPGKRTFRTYMFRDYSFNISVKRCARIMQMMNLVANRPKKDAYKGQATHGHRCAAPGNKVKQEFYIGPRKVVLTDISYFYYGEYRSVIYHCSFRDAYTREILGWATSTRMTTDLVKEAYDLMMEKHGKELKGMECYIHSDQGSQYLSTTFKEILSNDGFIQSVSRRGNCA